MPDEDVARRLQDVVDLELRRAARLRGAVVEVGDDVARVVGLPACGADELVVFASGALGMAHELAPSHTGVVLLQGAERVCAGDGVEAVGRPPSVQVGRELLGRVLDPLGRPRDDGPPPAGKRQPVFRPAPALSERAPVVRPLLTGVMVIDAAIPIGRGQRQLIVGDHNVGKTALALDIIAAQVPAKVSCVYVAIGQPSSRVQGVREQLELCGALAGTVVIASEAGDPPGLQYLAPYAGATVAEHFRDAGQDALIVFDDLTKHADAYRELALLLGRPPGREAFPGDIFYIHAQLLERATALSEAAGGGSLTALPIVETTESDITAYIPTNLISITDGQLYLDSALFARNQLPAVDVGRSVSRVGGAAQPASLRAAARNLRIAMSRFESLEALTRVGLDVDPSTREALVRGHLLRELLRQPRFTVRTLADQVIALTAVSEGWLDAVPPDAAAETVWALGRRALAQNPNLLENEAWKQQLARLWGRAPEPCR
ncbi:F0F1 ATP synthase subunit alpha [Comamonas sp. JC664]|uniref:F0F1 ATP synthase subunit alpha n=1 Tax=Comamonas sp. JC664 TaxID=2801917 RepID=UPI00174B7603|nr:F0F1 ATP synthase subunit alpha [Comamonas sp. JC664]MBL0694630.1 F0F1 ATP synthase subunit alpha [Comamonas sp. JC664]